MFQPLEAIVEEHGTVRLLETVRLDQRHRTLAQPLADEPSAVNETALLS